MGFIDEGTPIVPAQITSVYSWRVCLPFSVKII
jgi:hypothetical protein